MNYNIAITERLIATCCLVTLLFAMGCGKEKEFTPTDVAISWADMALFIAKKTPSNSPTFASRGFGYIGLTAYESVVQGYPSHHSLSSQLNGMPQMPKATEQAYDWVLAFNAGQASILKNIYLQTSDQNKVKIDSLEGLIYRQFKNKLTDPSIADRSVSFGREIASVIFAWSQTDGGHRAYLKNFDKSFQFPNTPGSWEPPLYGQSFSHFPLHPNWGKNRTFLKENTDLPAPVMISYDSVTTSNYFDQFHQVYEKSRTLTNEEKELALWYNDDPGETFTPPGHSYYIATSVIKKSRPELIECAETMARVGMAVADAFINCWKWKYHYLSERPSSYITRRIDPRWESFWPDPPFPAFPSGHAIQSAAASTVLADLYGERYEFIDSAHVGRPPDELRQVAFKPRTTHSFWQIAEETAYSRFCGGIHSPQDNLAGLQEGKKIGERINKLRWHQDTNH